MLNSNILEPIPLDDDALDEAPPSTQNSASIAFRLQSYGILPAGHAAMNERTLVQLEQLFVTWYELADDGSRRAAISYLFATEKEIRDVLFALVPLYYDPLFFDERTPTQDLVEIALVAHTKWRRWLDSSTS